MAKVTDTILYVKNTQGGDYVAVGGSDGASFVMKRALEDQHFSRELAIVGRSYSAAARYADERIASAKVSAPGILARGLDTRNAPHCSKSVQDNRAAGKPAKAAPVAVPAKVAKEARKAERADKAAPKADDARSLTVLDKDYAFGTAGTARRQCWDLAVKSPTVAAYIAAGGKAKYLPRWQSAGAVKLG